MTIVEKIEKKTLLNTVQLSENSLKNTEISVEEPKKIDEDLSVNTDFSREVQNIKELNVVRKKAKKRTNKDIYRVMVNKCGTLLLKNRTTHMSNKEQTVVLVRKIEYFRTTLENYLSVLNDNCSSTIILCCLEHQLIYFRGICKLCMNLSHPKIKRTIDKLLSQKIIRELPKLTDRARFFNSIILRNNARNLMYDSIKKIKYYELTEEAQDFFSRLKGDLLKATTYQLEIERFTSILRETHKQREQKAYDNQHKLNKSLRILRQNIDDNERYRRLLEVHANNILLRSGICMSEEQLDYLVRTAPSVFEEKKKKPRKPNSLNKLL